jgi:hypothetical protein
MLISPPKSTMPVIVSYAPKIGDFQVRYGHVFQQWIDQNPSHSTPLNAASGSNIGDNADLPTLTFKPLANVVEEGNSTDPVGNLYLFENVAD